MGGLLYRSIDRSDSRAKGKELARPHCWRKALMEECMWWHQTVRSSVKKAAARRAPNTNTNQHPPTRRRRKSSTAESPTRTSDAPLSKAGSFLKGFRVKLASIDRSMHDPSKSFGLASPTGLWSSACKLRKTWIWRDNWGRWRWRTTTHPKRSIIKSRRCNTSTATTHPPKPKSPNSRRGATLLIQLDAASTPIVL